MAWAGRIYKLFKVTQEPLLQSVFQGKENITLLTQHQPEMTDHPKQSCSTCLSDASSDPKVHNQRWYFRIDLRWKIKDEFQINAVTTIFSYLKKILKCKPGSIYFWTINLFSLIQYEKKNLLDLQNALYPSIIFFSESVLDLCLHTLLTVFLSLCIHRYKVHLWQGYRGIKGQVKKFSRSWGQCVTRNYYWAIWCPPDFSLQTCMHHLIAYKQWLEIWGIPFDSAINELTGLESDFF